MQKDISMHSRPPPARVHAAAPVVSAALAEEQRSLGSGTARGGGEPPRSMPPSLMEPAAQSSAPPGPLLGAELEAALTRLCALPATEWRGRALLRILTTAACVAVGRGGGLSGVK